MKQRTRLMHGDELMGQGAGARKDDGEEESEIPLHRMRAPEHFIEAQVQDGDTLQAIALRFYCPISELKRINHMHKDNEIFARRTIKVPVTPYSVLTELLPNPSGLVPSTSDNTPRTHNTLVNNPNGLQQPINTQTDDIEINGNSDFAIDCNAIVLNSTLAPSVIPFTDTEPNESVNEDTQLLPNKYREPVEAVVVKNLTSQGADFGIKWFHLVCCMLVLGVLVPLMYVVFFLDKHEVVQHPNEYEDKPPLGYNQ